MRDIEFRCWDTGINFMYYDTDCYNIYNENDNGLHSGYEDKYGTWHQNKLMQFTGLRDKNNVKIYEGDIIDVQYNYIKNAIVKFNNGKYNVADYVLSKCEVIGNIYQNPELFEHK